MNWDTALTALLVASAFVAVAARGLLARRASRSGAEPSPGCSSACAGCQLSDPRALLDTVDACGGEKP